MKKIIFLVLPFFLVACNATKSNTAEKQEHTKDNQIENVIAPSLYLENRVQNCDSALIFMRNVISPGILTRSKLPEIQVKPFIYGENEWLSIEKGNKSSYFRFFISLECLEGQDCQTIYDIFVEKKYHYLLKEAEAKSGAKGYWLVFRSLHGIGIQIKNGKVFRTSLSKTIRVK